MIKDTILTNRLILRELKKEDDHDWFEIFSSPKVGEFLHQISDIESAQRMINKKIDKYQNRPGQSFSVLLRGDSANKVIGNVELKIDEAESVAEVSYVFNDKYWDNGYATESALALIDYAFKKLNIKKIVADCLESNLASCHILKDKLHMNQAHIETHVDKTTNNLLNFICFELKNE